MHRWECPFTNQISILYQGSNDKCGNNLATLHMHKDADMCSTLIKQFSEIEAYSE